MRALHRKSTSRAERAFRPWHTETLGIILGTGVCPKTGGRTTRQPTGPGYTIRDSEGSSSNASAFHEPSPHTAAPPSRREASLVAAQAPAGGVTARVTRGAQHRATERTPLASKRPRAAAAHRARCKRRSPLSLSPTKERFSRVAAKDEPTDSAEPS